MKIHHALSVLVCSLFTTFFYAVHDEGVKQSPHFRSVASRLLVIQTHLPLPLIPSNNSIDGLDGMTPEAGTPTKGHQASRVLHGYSPLSPKKKSDVGPGHGHSPIRRGCSSGGLDHLA